MISRCPSCAAQVDDDAARCPSCHWDFNARRRIPPAGADKTAAPKPAAPAPEKPASPPSPAGIKMVPFSETLGGLTPAARPVEKPAPAPAPAPAPPPPLAKRPDPAKEQPAKREPEPPKKDAQRKEQPASASPGLHQFPKVDPAKLRRGDDLPFTLPTESTPAPRPAMPPAKSLGAAAPPKKEPPPREPSRKEAPKEPHKEFLPPNTVMRKVGAAPSPKPAAADGKGKPGKVPLSGAKPTLPPPPESGSSARRAPAFPWAGAAAALVVIGAAIAVFLNMRQDSGVMSKATASTAAIFAKGAATVKIDAGALLGGEQNNRDIRNIQRVAIDPTRPDMPPARLEAPPPAPAAPAPAAKDVERKAPRAAEPIVLLSSAALPVQTPEGEGDEPAPKQPTVVLLRKTMGGPVSASNLPKVVKSQWVFEGRVYDLVTLRSVPAATLRFLRGDELAGETETSADGTFRVELEPLAATGYRVVLKHSEYEFYLDEEDPPFSRMARADRLAAAAYHPSNRVWRGSTDKATYRALVAIPRLLPADAQ